MRMRRRKRSSWDSGSGYVPSCSRGFWVASTMKGRGSGYVVWSSETCASFMASSRLDCVLGVVRLISSASTMFVKIGPGLKTNSLLGRLVDADAEDVGRQHVGGELDPLEAGADGAGERRGQRGLADPGHVLDQEVPAREEPHDGQPDHLWLADEGAADAGLETVDQIERVGHGLPIYTGAPAGQQVGKSAKDSAEDGGGDGVPDDETAHGVAPV